MKVLLDLLKLCFTEQRTVAPLWSIHWSTQNVNLALDMTYSMHNNFLVDSKEAKAKINADVSPVQKPGKSNDQQK